MCPLGCLWMKETDTLGKREKKNPVVECVYVELLVVLHKDLPDGYPGEVLCVCVSVHI